MIIKKDTLQNITDMDFRKLYQNISFPVVLTRELLQDYGYDFVVEPELPQYNNDIHYLTRGTWELTENGYCRPFIINERVFTAEELLNIANINKQNKLNELANLRFQKETAGIEINGMKIKTDRESQALINGAYVSTIINPDFTIDWKCENGWITLNATQISAIASNVANHVQSCFTREKALQEILTVNPETEIIW